MHMHGGGINAEDMVITNKTKMFFILLDVRTLHAIIRFYQFLRMISHVAIKRYLFI